MKQLELFRDERGFFERLCTRAALEAGFLAVKRNGGSPGIDGITVSDFDICREEELKCLKRELESWTYQPSPVRRVEIPKPGKDAGVRLLGIPCVRDRVVQATLKRILEPILEPQFSDNSYGFRPGRSQRQAVEAARQIVKSGKEYVLDIDLSKFFDRVNQDRLIFRLSLFVPDKRILRIIGITLRSGVMIDGLWTPTTEGTVQGSPLSPLLSNVVLDELDKELEHRGLEFCRFADDCNIFVGSQKAAERVMQTIGKFIENKLKLVVNREKSKVALSRFVKSLGMTIITCAIAISAVSIKRAMEKVKGLTPRGTHMKIRETIETVNTWYAGWSGYCQMTQYPAQLAKIEAHVRRWLRMRLISQQKKKRHLFNNLVKCGVSRTQAARTVFSNRGRWALFHMQAVEKAYSNQWFIEMMGQKIRSNAAQPHWFSVNRWIKVI